MLAHFSKDYNNMLHYIIYLIEMSLMSFQHAPYLLPTCFQWAPKSFLPWFPYLFLFLKPLQISLKPSPELHQAGFQPAHTLLKTFSWTALNLHLTCSIQYLQHMHAGINIFIKSKGGQFVCNIWLNGLAMLNLKYLHKIEMEKCFGGHCMES